MFRTDFSPLILYFTETNISPHLKDNIHIGGSLDEYEKDVSKSCGKYGITVEEVKHQMQPTIDEPYNNPNHSDMTMAYQDRVPRKG